MAAAPEAEGERLVVLGRVSGLYGVRGWVRVYSYTEPREGILRYDPWYLGHGGRWRRMDLVGGRRHGKGVVAALAGVADRDAAAALMGAQIAVRRSQLPPPAEGEYYWADLIGLEVRTVEGTPLGKVADLMETGANDVLVVRGERERLIPFLPGQVVRRVDVAGGLLEVDWDPGF
ncbi:ribosome maturation factor RimM [Inmirania thermothiophila]|uniref:Ribosome maturation factor RimM n=1 Tax=Inmirania thermothiophila TaxID=1750597 RepID=A0A3N1XT60_9GAMM|nr:ribosome maturation factor RimM [Inmirania thermothiophila]ROR29825.1 16S rRNA processing protein RimM [Inmirania thermothiophila]